MTREHGNLIDEHVNVGDQVVANQALRGQYRINTNDRFDIESQDRFLVTRVFRESLQVRSTRTYAVRQSHHWAQTNVSFSISRGFLMFEDPNYVPPPPPRKLGVKPEDTPEMTYIGVDDPRVQWLFEDLGTYANGKNWCPQYDDLCRELGIPGRPRDFNVTRTLNGIQVRASIKARSQAEANAMFARAISTPESDPAPEPDFAPAA